MSNTPKIRFKGYADDWEQRKLLDLLVQPVSDGPHETPDLVDDGIPFISVDAIVDNKIDFDRKRGYITEEYDLECRKKYSPQRDDVYLVKSGATVGKVAIVETDERFNIWSPLAAMRTNKDLMLPKYLYFYLQLKDVQDEIYEKSIGGTQPNLSMRVLEKFDIKVPDIDEQSKIVLALENLDNLITLHQRKCEETKSLKKYMLQKMFPKNGEAVPEIRFAGFTDDWEQRKVSDLLEERNEQAPESEDYPLMAFIANEGVAPKGERYDRGALVKDAENKNYKKTELGDFIYSSNNLETGSIGLNNYGNASISPVYSIFKPTGIADSDFIGRRFVRKDFINSMVKWRQGVVYGQWKIHESDFLKIEVAVPSLEEQRKIGSYLSELDNLITLHQRKCDELKELKRYMLKNMFPTA